MGAAALWVLSKSLSEITAVFQEKNSVKTLKNLDEVTMTYLPIKSISQKQNSMPSNERQEFIFNRAKRSLAIIALFKTNQ